MMKKHLLHLLLCLLLLTGCGTPGEPVPSTDAPAPMVTEAPTAPPATEPALTEPLISRSLGRGDAGGMTVFGDDLLVFFSGEATTLTRLDGQTLEPIAHTELGTFIYPENPSVQVSAKGVTYYDDIGHALIFLDADLNEVNQFPLPEDCIGEPALAADRKTLYYMTGSALRVLDLESGMDRLLKEMSYDSQSITALHCDDTILEINTSDYDGDWAYVYLSTTDGRLLAENQEYVTLRTQGDRFFATAMDSIYEEKLTGLRGGDIRMLHCPDPDATAYPVLAQNAVVTTSEHPDGSVALDYYRLSDGTHPYSLILPMGTYPWHVSGAGEESCLWFISYDDESGMDTVYRWNFEHTPIEDDTVYIGIRRTAENPDEFGLAKCAEYAREISEKHSVTVNIWLDASAAEPWDYQIIPEYQVSVIRDALERLDAALVNFPAGMLSDATRELGDGKLRIGLVRGLQGVADSGALDTASGIQFWDDNGNTHISLEIGYSLEQNLYHEIYHVLESRIYSHSQGLDNWDDLNPPGFSYDYEYRSYQDRTDYHLAYGEDRAFVDMYSMTYPKEDRARILEYAMMPDNAFMFTSETMQKKLLTLCTAIREAYDLETATEAFLWEQYLAEPIHAIG